MPRKARSSDASAALSFPMVPSSIGTRARLPGASHPRRAVDGEWPASKAATEGQQPPRPRRDLAVLAASVVRKDTGRLRVLDLMTGCGVR